jgi:predicted Kef-type K+ transport protein
VWRLNPTLLRSCYVSCQGTLYLVAGFSLAVLSEFQYILEILSLSLPRVMRSETKFYVASTVLYYYTCEIVREGNVNDFKISEFCS